MTKDSQDLKSAPQLISKAIQECLTFFIGLIFTPAQMDILVSHIVIAQDDITAQDSPATQDSTAIQDDIPTQEEQ